MAKCPVEAERQLAEAQLIAYASWSGALIPRAMPTAKAPTIVSPAPTGFTTSILGARPRKSPSSQAMTAPLPPSETTTWEIPRSCSSCAAA